MQKVAPNSLTHYSISLVFENHKNTETKNFLGIFQVMIFQSFYKMTNLIADR